MYFERAGKENTEKTLEIAIEEAKKRGISHIIVASTTGETGLRAIRLLNERGVQPNGPTLIVVTHNVGFKEVGKVDMDEGARRQIEAQGARVHTGTMVLRGMGKAITAKFGYSQMDLVAAVLRMFGQGVKVCVEIAAMAADAGLIPFADVIAVAGTGRGADTAAVIKANSSNNFFDIKIREILAKPKEF